MAYATGFRYDLFISYAASDNRDGWVEQFQSKLESELNRILGRPVSIFFDKIRTLGDSARLVDFSTILGETAILVPILSPSYFDSDWCTHERQQFLAKRAVERAAPDSVVAPVLIAPIGSHAEDTWLEPLKLFSFLRLDGQTAFAPDSPEWSILVRRFVDELGGALVDLRPTDPEFRSAKTVGDLFGSFKCSESIIEIMRGAAGYSSSGTLEIASLVRSAAQYGRTQPKSSAAAFLFQILGQRTEDVIVPVPPGMVEHLEVSVGVWSAFENAKRIRLETGGQDDFIGFRHVLFALATTRETRVELSTVLQPFGGMNADSLAVALIPLLQQSLEKNESWDAWLHIFEQVNLAPLEIPTELADAPKPVVAGVWQGQVFAGYQPDDPNKGDDFLGIAKEAEALTTVLAAKDVEPPLSLGLFGEWGSGKSFFMRLIEKSVDDLRADAEAANGESAYCQDIVQLTFNAWSYIDSNLWASLTAKIFEGLAGALARKRTGTDTQQERELVMAAVSSSQGVIEAAEQRKQDAESELKRVEGELGHLQKSARDIDDRLTAADLLHEAFAFAVADPEVQDYLGEAAKQLHLPEAEAAAAETKKQILELHDTGSAILFAIRRNKNLWIWMAALGAALLLGLVTNELLARLRPPDFARITAPLLAAAGAFLTPFVRMARNALATVRRAQKSKHDLIEKKKEERKQELETFRTEIKSRLEAAEAERKAAKEKLEKLNEQLEKMRADRQMADYIRQSNESADYTRHLGLIARVRSDFEHLSVLLRDVKEESQQELSERMKEKNGRKLFPRIQRIILYIDDLDRCPEKIVFEVLQRCTCCWHSPCS